MVRVTSAWVRLSEMDSAAISRARPYAFTKTNQDIVELFVEEVWIMAVQQSAFVAKQASIERRQLAFVQIDDGLELERRTSYDSVWIMAFDTVRLQA